MSHNHGFQISTLDPDTQELTEIVDPEERREVIRRRRELKFRYVRDPSRMLPAELQIYRSEVN